MGADAITAGLEHHQTARTRIGWIVALLVPLLISRPAAAEKPRLLVLTDIGGDPDDRQSMIRLMLYANEFDIEGLVASASGTPGELKEKVTKPHLIREIVEAYGRVRRNLSRHADGYPEPEALLGRVKSGNPDRGVAAIGEGKDTEASRWIVSVAGKSDPRPLNIAIWGGQTDLAQALWRVRNDRGAGGLLQFVARLRIHDIADQDGILDWMLREFPGLFYILSKAPDGQDRRLGAFRGMYLGGDESLTSREWLEANVLAGHGPLGALYPMATWTAPNPHKALKEGDTPSWFYFLPHGLNDPEHPEWGGWGGRFARADGTFYRDAHDTVSDITDARVTVSRWRAAFQGDFAARLDWCAQDSFGSANHAPRAVLNGDGTRNILQLEAGSGETVRLSAGGSRDPDGNALSFRWFVYPEAGTNREPVNLDGQEQAAVALSAPAVPTAQTLHVILSVTDSGLPPLTSHRRAVVTIHARPKQ